ncbi:TetR/AcrR family transcriptional regulator C-terminal domain-containing protein [Rhizobium sp. KVB221]|uniref:TetR/AcrR family transcriptional regulator C-terminal domain-containing protein n=1 Tax=Rhizobium setariae TaxID=2801340 RepID=A0A936YTV7_9HYPH|nr:TetR/AcrR family transcriptional regulator [Rhizobium setariae]MBL0374374.1 TetR/AcrR family transcriptional regulator C-terminal domain-containing protein [Rhizobium setariae]
MTTMPKKPKLTRETIVEAAIELIESEGLDSLSTRALGNRLGVQAMSLYHHVESKDVLLDLITARLATMIEFGDHTGNWRCELEAVSRSYIDIARRYPRSFPLLAARRFNTPETLPVLERILSIFRRAGLPPAGTAASFRILGYYLNGAGLTEGATIEAERRTDFHLQDSGFLEGFPVSGETVAHLALPNLSGIFEKGLEVILDSIEDEIRLTRVNRPHSV